MTDQERCEAVARGIEALLREHQLAGFYMVAAPTHAAHSLKLDSAPWLRLSVDTGAADGAVIGVRVRSKLAEYTARGLPENEARAQQKREMEYTISALEFIATQAGPVALLAMDAYRMLQARFDSETWGDRVGDATGGPLS